jgi:cytochrome P450
MAFSNTSTIAAVAGVLLLFYHLLHKVVLHYRHIQKAKELGCQPVPLEPTKWPLGIDIVLRMLEAAKQERVPDFLEDRFKAMGPRYTWKMKVLGTSNLITAEPKNVQAILATQFNDFAMGATRIQNLKQVLGRSIFTVDGQAWHNAREMVRPICKSESKVKLQPAIREVVLRVCIQLPARTSRTWHSWKSI